MLAKARGFPSELLMWRDEERNPSFFLREKRGLYSLDPRRGRRSGRGVDVEGCEQERRRGEDRKEVSNRFDSSRRTTRDAGLTGLMRRIELRDPVRGERSRIGHGFAFFLRERLLALGGKSRKTANEIDPRPFVPPAGRRHRHSFIFLGNILLRWMAELEI